MAKVDVLIAGGGISGLATLHFLRRNKPQLTVRLLEADNRLGGTIGTDQIDGYSFDWGPNGFLDREPLTLQLCDELGLKERLERANESVNARFILRGGRLRPVPMSPPKFLMSSILSWRGKFRLALEPWAKPRPDGVDESVYDFVARRIGQEAADYLVQPMVSGVYGGVAKRLSLQSCFPIMREMEDQYGSLIKALFAKARAARASGKKAGGPGGPGGWLTSFFGGLYPVIERFAELYSDQITCGVGVKSVRRDNGELRVELSDGAVETCRHLVLATPSYAAAQIVGELSQPLAEALGKIPYAPIAVVCLGYDAAQVRNSVDGFGFLVPQKEQRRILGAIWTSSIFAKRAPAGKIQFRTMVGGDGDHESIKLTDDELLNVTSSDLGEIMRITGAPETIKIYRWQYGIPQYRVGHRAIMDVVERELAALPQLHLASNAYYGIGLNDCVKQAHRVVEKIS